ncbi:hypothetical protein GX51_05242 [Blastomyces parvus]|uniref:Uncharacterized protein n=1 Tax=Blastomyces parvus TaxID=2060905 RepID=A0A2B7WXM7_9EURO|nr:hypothetical protein GX51_05242 [Blastomyces parvus]
MRQMGWVEPSIAAQGRDCTKLLQNFSYLGNRAMREPQLYHGFFPPHPFAPLKESLDWIHTEHSEARSQPRSRRRQAALPKCVQPTLADGLTFNKVAKALQAGMTAAHQTGREEDISAQGFVRWDIWLAPCPRRHRGWKQQSTAARRKLLPFFFFSFSIAGPFSLNSAPFSEHINPRAVHCANYSVKQTQNSSFDCADDPGRLCKRYLNTPVALPFPSNEATTTRTARIVYATPIQIRFQMTDSSVVPIPTESLKLPHARKPLSKGAKAGIAVGVIAAVFLGIVAAVCWSKRAKKRRTSTADDAATVPLYGGGNDASVPLQGQEYPPTLNEQATAPPTYHDATGK